jgi:hypothetical protein
MMTKENFEKAQALIREIRKMRNLIGENEPNPWLDQPKIDTIANDELILVIIKRKITEKEQELRDLIPIKLP